MPACENPNYSLYCIVQSIIEQAKIMPISSLIFSKFNFSSNDGSKIAPFNWECDYIKLFFGSDYKHDLNYDEFTQFIQGFLHIYAVQAFWRARKDMEGYVTPTGMSRNTRFFLKIYFSVFQYYEADQTISVDQLDRRTSYCPRSSF